MPHLFALKGVFLTSEPFQVYRTTVTSENGKGLLFSRIFPSVSFRTTFRCSEKLFSGGEAALAFFGLMNSHWYVLS